MLCDNKQTNEDFGSFFVYKRLQEIGVNHRCTSPIASFLGLQFLSSLVAFIPSYILKVKVVKAWEEGYFVQTVYNCVCICILKVAEAWERGKSLVHTVLVIILPPLYLHTESKTTKEQTW